MTTGDKTRQMTKKQFNKKFPNGLTNWIETHHEVVAFIASQLMSRTGEDCEIMKVEYTQGTGGIYDLAEEWTDEFEATHLDREWDGEFFDEIEKFCNSKNTVITA